MSISKQKMAKQIKRVQKLASKYREILMLHDWDVDFTISKLETHDGGACGRVEYLQTEYKTAGIVIYQSSFRKNEDLEHIICHELCHLLTEKLYLIAHNFLNGEMRTSYELNDRREELTEKIAKIVRNATR